MNDQSIALNGKHCVQSQYKKLLRLGGPFASVWPFYTYIGSYTTIWGPFPSTTLSGCVGSGVVCANSEFSRVNRHLNIFSLPVACN